MCKIDSNLTLDHHFPLSKGNALTITNCIILCMSCNSSKGAKNPIDFYTNEELLELNFLLKTREVNFV